MVVYLKSKNLPYEVYEFMAEPSHFQYFAGIKNPQAIDLYFAKIMKKDLSMRKFEKFHMRILTFAKICHIIIIQG